MATKIPTDLLGQPIFPGDLVIYIHSENRGSVSSVRVVYHVNAKSVSFSESNERCDARSIKCIKVTEEQAFNHRVENYNGKSEEEREYVVEKKIEEARLYKEKIGRVEE